VFSSRFPPGYPIALALGQRLLFWVEPYWAQRWTSVALGTAGAVLTAALAWRLTSTATVRTRVVATVATGVVIACHPPVGEATEPFTLGPSFGTSLEAELNAAQLRAALRRIGDDPVPSLTAIPFRWARGIGVLTTDYDVGSPSSRCSCSRWRGAGRVSARHCVTSSCRLASSPPASSSPRGSC
jgi:hypothetical protein